MNLQTAAKEIFKHKINLPAPKKRRIKFSTKSGISPHEENKSLSVTAVIFSLHSKQQIEQIENVTWVSTVLVCLLILITAGVTCSHFLLDFGNRWYGSVVQNTLLANKKMGTSSTLTPAGRGALLLSWQMVSRCWISGESKASWRRTDYFFWSLFL